jgi:hypothetical protein
MESVHLAVGSLLMASSTELKALEVIIDSVERGEPISGGDAAEPFGEVLES